jgi:hypothetical protein
MFIMFINRATDVAIAPTYCSNGAFVECLAGVLQSLSIFVILDVLYEYPSTTRTPSAREEARNSVEELAGLSRSNVFLCITSRPKWDIQTVLDPLTSMPLLGGGSPFTRNAVREDISRHIRPLVAEEKDSLCSRVRLKALCNPSSRLVPPHTFALQASSFKASS